MESTKQSLLRKWSEKWVPLFNRLSEKYTNPYYTQSPLNAVEEDIDLMFVGINPGEPDEGCKKASNLSPEQFLRGNPSWEERFKNGKNVWRFTNGARFFLGYDVYRHKETIDNDKRVVWTNLSPFISKKGFSDLKPELKEEGIKSFIELVTILKPKKIVLLGGNAFSLLYKFATEDIKRHIEHMKVYDNLPLEIGRIYNSPAYNVSHPSGKWAVSHCFIPVFIYFRDLYDTYEDGKPKFKLKDIREKMRKEMRLWQEHIKAED